MRAVESFSKLLHSTLCSTGVQTVCSGASISSCGTSGVLPQLGYYPSWGTTPVLLHQRVEHVVHSLENNGHRAHATTKKQHVLSFHDGGAGGGSLAADF